MELGISTQLKANGFTIHNKAHYMQLVSSLHNVIILMSKVKNKSTTTYTAANQVSVLLTSLNKKKEFLEAALQSPMNFGPRPHSEGATPVGCGEPSNI